MINNFSSNFFFVLGILSISYLQHCEEMIETLQRRLADSQEQLAMSVSTERKKDVMIDQLDKVKTVVVRLSTMFTKFFFPPGLIRVKSRKGREGLFIQLLAARLCNRLR
jgi:hypothetical protein